MKGESSCCKVCYSSETTDRIDVQEELSHQNSCGQVYETLEFFLLDLQFYAVDSVQTQLVVTLMFGFQLENVPTSCWKYPAVCGKCP